MASPVAEPLVSLRPGRTRRLLGPVVFMLCALGLGGPVAVAAESESDVAHEHTMAVERARAGDLQGAAAVLGRLHDSHPGDIGVLRDLIVVSGWAGGRDAEMIRLFETLPGGSAAQPGYVLESVAKAYRNEHRFDEAVELYRLARRRDPGNAALATGEVGSLVDGRRLDEAASVVAAALARQRGKALAELLLARAYLEEAREEPVEALHDYQRALAEEPENAEALRGRAFALERLGAPELARRIAENAPIAFSETEKRRLDDSAAAELVRFGPLPTIRESERFAGVDRAIDALDDLIARWSAENGEGRDAAIRARLDRLVAYRNRVRMRDVIDEYRRLLDEGVELPPYALEAVADAYLYLHEPERAAALYRAALERAPGSVDAGLGLYHALVESGDIEAAIARIDTLQESLSPWIALKGLAYPLPNDARVRADIAAANARLEANAPAEAERRFETMAALAPENSAIRGGLAGIYGARGWPRRAGEEIEAALRQDPNDTALRVASADNRLALSEWRAAEREIAALNQRAPENLQARRLARDWELHDSAELSVDVDVAFRSGTDVRGGSGYAVGATLFSPPIAYDWHSSPAAAWPSKRCPKATSRYSAIRPASSSGIET
jgi:biofilm PGA synthesis protein PgaA